MANEEFGADLITLVDDEGHEHEFEIVDTLELGEQHYVRWSRTAAKRTATARTTASW